MSFVTLLVYAALARAHGSDRSHQFMVDLARAVTRPELVIAAAEHQPLADQGIADAVATLERGIAATRLVADTCAEDLYPSAMRERDAAERDAYGALYVRHVREFVIALTEFRDEFLRQAARPAEERDVAALRELQARHRDLSRRAHSELKR